MIIIDSKIIKYVINSELENQSYEVIIWLIFWYIFPLEKTNVCSYNKNRKKVKEWDG